MSTVSNLLQFLNSSPTPFHAVQSIKRQLIESGFLELRESQLWETGQGGKYYVTRGETSIVAWIQGESLPEHGAHIVGAHTDSPNLRLKPHPNITRSGYRQLGVEVYGGVLLGTWTDRDLSLAGRVFVESENGLKTYPLLCKRPLVRIPQLAIHLNREVNDKGLQLNKQKHLPPILTKSQNWETEDALKFWLAEELDLEASKIRSWDLSLYDTHPAQCWGPDLEFIASARLDNLFCCFTGLQALCHSNSPKPWTQVLVCYDHEEIGSQTTEGAHSSFLEFVIRRLAEQ
ncbi:MAG: M18 family aminopeptidase, partial [bacterium]